MYGEILAELTKKSTPAEAIQALLVHGLDPSVAQAMDIVRVTGNKALHGYQIAEDEANAAPTAALIDLLNYIIEDRITKPARMASLFAKLPQEEKFKVKKETIKFNLLELQNDHSVYTISHQTGGGIDVRCYFERNRCGYHAEASDRNRIRMFSHA